MNYYEIGQQVRRYRKICGLSQEQLAEAVGISVTHMSHIKTGNTKLSLPVFVDLAQALQVRTDDLLLKPQPKRQILTNELSLLAKDRTKDQLYIITEVAKATRTALKKLEPAPN